MRSERLRLLVLGLALVGCAALIGIASMGHKEAASRASGPKIPIPLATAGAPRATTPNAPTNFWTDYVLVDAVEGHTLAVHSTRGPGHFDGPYSIVSDENTILEPPNGLFRPAPDIRPGSSFYFTGVVEVGAPPSPTSVRALRIFEFDGSPGAGS